MIKEVVAVPQASALTADVQGIGYALADLACLYQGQEVPTRSDNRLWLALEALRGNQTLPPTPVSGKHIHMLLVTVHLWTGVQALNHIPPGTNSMSVSPAMCLAV